MDNYVIVLIPCVLWILPYSAGFTDDCCRVTLTTETRNVTCSGCGLQDVPNDLPINITELNLPNNSLSILHRKAFFNLVDLERLNLSKNKLYAISSGTFDDLRNLEYLDLSNNNLNLSSFVPSTFHILNSLKCLNITKNTFHLMKSYPEDAISQLSQLQSLTIDIFEGFNFGNGFLNLTNLNNLEFNFIGKEWVSFRNSSFQGLKNSNISHLNIKALIREVEINYLSPFSKLTSFSLHSQRTITIKKILRALYGLRERTMESLSLISNAVLFYGTQNLVKADLLYLGTICVKELDLTKNSLDSITMEAVKFWTKKTCLEVLNLSRNQFYAGQMITLLNLFPSITYVDFSYMRHTLIRKRAILYGEQVLFLPTHLRFLIMTHDQFNGPLINLTISRNNNLQLLDISYPSRNLSCSYGLLKGLVHLKEYDMSGIDCSDPNPNMFTSMPSLSRLTVRHCNLNESLASNRTSLFKGLNNLTLVDMSSNHLKRLNNRIFNDQKESLTTLILAKNTMERLPIESLQHLSVLETLDLSNNLISTLRESEYTQLDTLKAKSEKFTVRLSGNPLVCSCDNLAFILWIESTQVIYNKDELMCAIPGGSQLKIRRFLETIDQFQESCVSQFWLIVSVVLFVFLFILGILSRESWRRSVWLRVKCRRPLKQDKYPYDIFISYCDEDCSWVAKTFVPWLDERGIKYCFDEKSFSPGRDICENIMDSIDKSHQTVFVVSCTFLEREWTMFAMKLASFYSFRDGRQNMNIIILLDDIKKSEFPKLMRKNWDVVCSLRWPNGSNMVQRNLKTAEKIFWTKLLKHIQREKGSYPSAKVSESSF